MKSYRILGRLFAVCTFSLLSFASVHAFEGKVSMTMTSNKETLPITYYIKGTHMRVEMSPPPDRKGNKMTMTMLTDWDARQVTILMNEQKMYMVHSIPQVDTQKPTKDEMDFKPTGRTEKIADYDTQEFVGNSEGKRTEIWVTKSLGAFMMANMGRSRKPDQAARWEAFMRGEGFFAMRVIQRPKEGAPETMHMEVTNVDKSPLPDSFFNPPADFKKFEMPDLGGALKGLIPGSH